MSTSTATNWALHREAEAIARRILSRKVTDHDATLVFELSNRLLRAEDDTRALQATASAARHACKLAEQQRDELLAALRDLSVYDSYDTEYDGQMLSLCPDCGKQDGEHSARCDFALARALIAKVGGIRA